MRTTNPGMNYQLESSRLTTRINDATNEWLTYYDTDIEYIGLSIAPLTHEVEVCTQSECEPGYHWIPMDTIVPDGETDIEAIMDLADRFCFD